MSFMAKRKFSKVQELGQGMTEYIIIVALISVAAIAVYQLFGATVRNQMAGIAREVAGKDGTNAMNQAGTSAANAVTQAAKERTLSSYSNQATDGAQGGGAQGGQ